MEKSNRGMPVPPAHNQAVEEQSAEMPVASKPIVANHPLFSEQMNNSEVVVPNVIRRSGIEVKAIRPGFHDQQRRKEGEVFMISGENELGEWMECVDLGMRKKHQDLIKKRKQPAGK